MSYLIWLAQLVLDILFGVVLVVLWSQWRRSKKEDPQVLNGFHEIQNKISVLEDLGDRTERQVQQLMAILETKVIEIQKKIDQADNVQGQISKSMEKSLEVAKIFQDKIPHDEIRERQNTVKFVKAALMAHQGYSALEISEQVDLPFGELEFIVKVNRDELSFDHTQLPDWVQSELSHITFSIKDEVRFLDRPLKAPPRVKPSIGLTSNDHQALQSLGEKFRQAQITNVAIGENTKLFTNIEPKVLPLEKQEKTNESAILKKGKDLGIRPVVFPRIETNK